MWRLFRRKPIPASRPARVPEPVSRTTSARHEPQSLDGYSVRVLTREDAVQSIRFDELTAEQLRRVLAANSTSVDARARDNAVRSGEALS